MKKYLKRGVELLRLYAAELLIITLIILNILDFLELLPANVSYIKKIISYTALFYLFYSVSITKIFFKNKNKNIDFMIIFTYFLFAFYKWAASFGQITLKVGAILVDKIPTGMKAAIHHIPSVIQPTDVGYVLNTNITNLVSITNPSAFVQVTNSVSTQSYLIKSQASFLSYFIFLIQNAMQTMEKYLFIAAGILLIGIAIYIAYKLPAKYPSFAHSISRSRSKIKRSLVAFGILVGFYIIIANQALEWLAIGIDAPLLMIGIFFFLYLVIRHKERLKASNLLFKLGAWGDAFYAKFLELFKHKKKLLLAFSGILILFMVVDVGFFILPYTMGYDRGPDKPPILIDTLYYQQLNSTEHQPFSNVIINDLKSEAPLYKKVLSPLFYILNLIGVCMMMLLSALLWGLIYKKKKLHLSKFTIVLFFVSITAFFTAPALVLKTISAKNLVGVDITTQSIINTNLVMPLIFIIIALAASYLLARFLPKTAKVLITILSTAFFTFYMYLYGSSILGYNLAAIKGTFLMNPFISFYFVLFFLFYAVFYVVGYLSFLYEIYIKR